MARADLDELRLEIASLAYEAGAPLTEREFNSMSYWGEDQLHSTVESYAAIVEQESADEYDDESDSDSDDTYDDREGVARSRDDDYADGMYYDDSDVWEIEITCSYSEF